MLGGINIGSIGGGKELITLIQCETTEDLPISSVENTVAVITNITITDYYFSSSIPIVPSEGLVWIISNYATGNVITLKGNQRVEFYPAGAKIYTSGAWTSIPSYVYKNNAWKLLRFDIIVNGQFNAELFGELNRGYWNGDNYLPTIGYGADYISLTGFNSSYATSIGSMGFSRKIPLHHYGNIVAEIRKTSGQYTVIGYNISRTCNGLNSSFIELGRSEGLPTSVYSVVSYPITATEEAYLYIGQQNNCNTCLMVRNVYLV